MSVMSSGLRRSWWLVACLSMGLATASCANDAAIEDDADGISDLVEPVTDVSHTDVRNQSIGNCWSYASTGWLESLHRARTGQSVNVSESWITFWDWHRKIIGTGVTTNATTMRSEVSTSGWWDSAMTILRDRGVVMEAEFIPEEAASARSSRQSEALAAINAELNGEGRLATATARRDPQIVLNVLFDAWRINEDVRAELRPEDKTTAIGELSKAGSVAMIGDGINDAPALARADVGFALGTRAATALEAAGIALPRP
ncbi:MAG: HAD family hydrolase, partial [Gemmatimonadaceae bacterium]|nr:HAD family hydrolase [Gemmatimonadaceae bacterium]